MKTFLLVLVGNKGVAAFGCLSAQVDRTGLSVTTLQALPFIRPSHALWASCIDLLASTASSVQLQHTL